MIVLDTNVLSESVRPAPEPNVTRWLNDPLQETLFVTSVSLAELLYGIARLPAGRRLDALSVAMGGVLSLFDGRILSFDVAAAETYVRLALSAHTGGRGFATPDGNIAAIAASRGFRVCTRAGAPFRGAGVPVINPWQV